MPKHNTNYQILNHCRSAIIADWLLLLLQHAKPEYLARRFDAGHGYGDLKSSLELVRLRPKPRSIADLLAAGIHPGAMLNIGYLAMLLQTWGDIESHCRDFPCREDTHEPYPDGIDAFDLPWRLREELRLVTGTYRKVPWADLLAAIPDHFVHLSMEDDGLVAYTADAGKGERDIQTPIKPARYLKRFYPDLADHIARDLADRIEQPARLQFAVTAEAIEDIYRTGPTSCMSRRPRDYDSSCHPVRVYGASDLQLAYITAKDGTPSARCLVWPEKKRHGRIYGHESRMLQALQRAGLGAGSFEGARLRRIAHDDDSDQLVMPYLDGLQQFDVLDDEWLVIRNEGDHEATSTSGLVRIAGFKMCAHCDHAIDEGDDSIDVGGEDWCQSCCDNHAFQSDYSGDYFHDGDSVTVHIQRTCRGELVEAIWAQCEADAHAFYCDGSDSYYHAGQFETVALANGDIWEKGYFEEHGDPADVADPPLPAQPIAHGAEAVQAGAA